eukprot:scaffold9739_cov117-Skeletonema_marinoi.AAC.1
MGMPPFGGLSFAQMPGFPTNTAATSYSSSSFYQSGGMGASSKMVSITKSSVNGKVVTRHEEVTVNPDGTKTTKVKISGDGLAQEEQSKRILPAINLKSQAAIKDGTKAAPNVVEEDTAEDDDLAKAKAIAMSLCLSESDYGVDSSGTSPPQQHCRVETKQHLEQHQQASRKVHPLIAKGKGYVIDSKEGERSSEASLEIPARHYKRKFCEIMSRCLSCCFPRPKRRRITGRRTYPDSAEKDHVDYSSLTVVQLRDILRRKGLKVSGKKSELLMRLEASNRCLNLN